MIQFDGKLSTLKPFLLFTFNYISVSLKFKLPGRKFHDERRRSFQLLSEFQLNFGAGKRKFRNYFIRSFEDQWSSRLRLGRELDCWLNWVKVLVDKRRASLVSLCGS
jgi:hypothetical protein